MRASRWTHGTPGRTATWPLPSSSCSSSSRWVVEIWLSTAIPMCLDLIESACSVLAVQRAVTQKPPHLLDLHVKLISNSMFLCQLQSAIFCIQSGLLSIYCSDGSACSGQISPVCWCSTETPAALPRLQTPKAHFVNSDNHSYIINVLLLSSSSQGLVWSWDFLQNFGITPNPPTPLPILFVCQASSTCILCHAQLQQLQSHVSLPYTSSL